MRFIIQNNNKVFNKDKDEHIVITTYFQLFARSGPIYGKKIHARSFSSKARTRRFMVQNNLNDNRNIIIKYDKSIDQ